MRHGRSVMRISFLWWCIRCGRSCRRNSVCRGVVHDVLHALCWILWCTIWYRRWRNWRWQKLKRRTIRLCIPRAFLSIIEHEFSVHAQVDVDFFVVIVFEDIESATGNGRKRHDTVAVVKISDDLFRNFIERFSRQSLFIIPVPVELNKLDDISSPSSFIALEIIKELHFRKSQHRLYRQ